MRNEHTRPSPSVSTIILPSGVATVSTWTIPPEGIQSANIDEEVASTAWVAGEGSWGKINVVKIWRAGDTSCPVSSSPACRRTNAETARSGLEHI